jgi:WD repeat-containing protein 91
MNADNSFTNNATGINNFSNTSVTQMDELVKEYLLFRGFNSTLKAFDNDLIKDKDKSLKPDKVTEQLFQFVYTFDLNGLLDYWSYLDSKYFSRLTLKLSPNSSVSLTRKYELFLLRYYLVYSIQSNKTDKALEFFENYSTKIQSQAEWKEWYSLPFIKNPEENPIFSVFFSKNWTESFYISLQNFLNVVFQSLSYPRLLNYEEDAFWNKQSSVLNKSNSINNDQESLNLTDEFQVADNNNQNKPANSLISIFKNFTNSKQKSNVVEQTKKTNIFKPTPNLKSSNLNTDNKISLMKKLNSPNETPNKEEIIKQFQSESVSNYNESNRNQRINTIANNNKLDETQVLAENNNENFKIKTESNSHFLILSQEDYTDHKHPIITCKTSRDGKNIISCDNQGIIKSKFFLYLYHYILYII